MAVRNDFCERFSRGLQGILGFQPTKRVAWEILRLALTELGKTLILDLQSGPASYIKGTLLVPRFGRFILHQGKTTRGQQWNHLSFIPKLKFHQSAAFTTAMVKDLKVPETEGPE